MAKKKVKKPRNKSASTNGGNGPDHGPDGRFVEGNSGGPGNPRAPRVQAWRTALAEAVTPEDVGDVVKVLVAAAKEGKPWAVTLLLDRCLGKPKQAIEIEAEIENTKTWYDNLPPDYPKFLDWLAVQNGRAHYVVADVP